MRWKPAHKVDLARLEDRLPPCKKLVTAWLSDYQVYYKIVDSKRKRNFKRKPPFIY